MKKGLFTKGLALLLCLLMLVPMIASCNNDEAETPETSGNNVPQTTTPPANEDEVDISEILNSSDYKMVVTEGTTDYVIVYPAGAETEKSVAESLKAKLEENTGAVIEVKDDSAAEAEKEILIGNTNRTADDTIFNGVKAKDYIVKVSGSKLLIAAYDSECYELAWKRAVIALNVTEAGGKYYAYFKTDYSYQRNGEYTAADLTVDGNSISKYVIVYGDDLEKTVAESVQLMIQEICGYILPVKKSTLASEAAELEIIVGDATGRVAAQLETENTYDFKAVGKLLVFYFTNDRSGKKAVMDYEAKLEELIAGGSTEIKTISVSGKMSNVGAGEVLCSQNFDSISGATTDAVLSSVGMSTIYANKYYNNMTGHDPDNTDDGKYAVASEVNNSAAIKINGGWTSYKVLSATNLVGVDAYTIQMDVKFDQKDDFGNFSLMFGGTADNTEAEKAGIQIRNLATGDANDTNQNGNATAYMGVRVIKDGSASTKLYNAGVKLTDVNKVIIEIDKTAGTIKVYVNETLLISETGHTVVNGDIALRVQNTFATIDNLIVSNGSYVDYQSAHSQG